MTKDRNILLETFMNNYNTIMKVDVYKGKVTFIKSEITYIEEDKEYDINKIRDYKNIFDGIEEKDIPVFRELFCIDRLREKCEAGKTKTLLEYRRREGKENKWARLILACPSGYCKKVPDVFICSYAMTESEGMNREAFEILKERFHKVFFNNYSTNQYLILKKYVVEDYIYSKNINMSLEGHKVMVEEGFIHKDDIENFLYNMEPKRIIDFFAEGNTSKAFYYRRRVAGLFRWVRHEIFPTSSYSKDNLAFIHFIIDVNPNIIRFLNRTSQYSIGKQYRGAEQVMMDKYIDNLLTVLNTFTDKYVDYFLVDLELDRYISYKIKSISLKEQQIESYTEVARRFIDSRCTKVKSSEMIIPFQSIEGLKELLEDKLTISREFIDDSGEVFTVSFYKVEARDGLPTKVLGNIIKTPNRKQLKVKAFGEFEVYSEDGKPIRFSKKKSKQLLAFLVDKRGFSVTGRDIAREILEREDYDANTIKYVSALVRYGIKDLEGYGYHNVIVKDGKDIYVNTNMIDCDYYHVMDGDSSYWHLYNNEYMKQYSWAEETNAEILHMFDV